MLTSLTHRLRQHQPFMITQSMPEAAVLMAITTGDEPALVLTRRASHMSTHQGQVAFPGGKRDPEDPDLLYTALREAEEEIALPPDQVDVIGPLSDVVSLHGIKVRPWVGLIPEGLPLKANEAELDAIFTMPLAYLQHDPRAWTDVIPVADKFWYVPAYCYAHYELWGLSAMMVVELLRVGFDLPISLHQPPPAGSRLRQRPVRQSFE
ncbi:coenzyme A pyrophosphatase [Terasakiispira papahanaumokuakeensis]|uniref:Coenzyme A pyrophosphatase n=1 Tax=Terasakiispira papahanaumokuakeensis TaxID=197479 RepID=A0A1E2V5C4_9GAMM|nr:CoA pyrophosphatase [Terasakiispira papahanaumokuakeensis]ODC02181.1 coenzyme A pyrophosphatase [Terasakiispira papahanaumokuakeensis]